MSNPASWQMSGSHPDGSTLLLHLDGELDAAAQSAVATHLQDCWLCRAECERLNRGMYYFVEHWERSVESSAAPPPNTGGLHRRLTDLVAEEPASPARSALGGLKRLLRVSLPGRAAWIPGMVSAAAFLAFAFFSVTDPAPVSAHQLLLRAGQFEPVLPKAGRAIHQKVRIRQAQRSAQRDLFVDAAGRQHAPRGDADPVLADAMQAIGADWSDPLNAATFASWRAAHAPLRDTVTESPLAYTVTTEFGGGPVLLASLTMRRTDWRPVAKRVEFRDRPALEITEESYQTEDVEEPAPRAPAAIAPAAPVVRNAPPPEAKTPAAAVHTPKETELDESEVRLREAFHQLDADRTDMPRIWRTDRNVNFEVFTQSPDREREILQAVAGISHVVRGVAPRESPGAVAADPVPMRNTTPPLAESLSNYFGGMDAANAYLRQVRDAYVRVLVDASALSRLAERYTDADWQRLPEESRITVEVIALDYAGGAQAGAREYLALVSPVLDEMRRQQEVAAPLDAESRFECAAWRADAAIVLRQAQRLQSSFRKLFLAEQTGEAEDPDVKALLRETTAARSYLQQMIQRPCQP